MQATEGSTAEANKLSMIGLCPSGLFIRSAAFTEQRSNGRRSSREGKQGSEQGQLPCFTDARSPPQKYRRSHQSLEEDVDPRDTSEAAVARR